MDRATPRPGVTHGIDFIKSRKPDRNHWDPKPDSHHPDSWAKLLQCAVQCPKAFGKNNRTIAAIDKLSRISKCAPCSRHLLRKRISVVNQTREEIRDG